MIYWQLSDDEKNIYRSGADRGYFIALSTVASWLRTQVQGSGPEIEGIASALAHVDGLIDQYAHKISGASKQ